MLQRQYYIGICDDEKVWREQVLQYCEKILYPGNVVPHYRLFTSGEELFKNFEDLDILFLDQELPGISGLHIKETFERLSKNVMIIFVTNYSEIIYDSFGKNVYGFLQKPIDYKRFEKLLTKLISILLNEDYIIAYDTKKGKMKIPCRDIWYIEADTNYSKITYGENKSTVIRKGLSDIEKELTFKYLVRIHKSYIINLCQGYNINGGVMICSKNKKAFPVARRKKKRIQDLFNDYVMERAQNTWNL